MVKVIGLNSGSSFDGVDVVLVEIEYGADGYPKRPKFIAGNTYEWPNAVVEMVLCRLAYWARWSFHLEWPRWGELNHAPH